MKRRRNIVIKYGLDKIEELVFTTFHIHIEKRDQQWIDIQLVPELAAGNELPTDLIDFDILVITNHEGIIAQIVPQDVGCDCEYQFTFSEKEQIKAFIQSDRVQKLIEQAAE